MGRSFFFNDTATTEIYTLSLHDALPIWPPPQRRCPSGSPRPGGRCPRSPSPSPAPAPSPRWRPPRSPSRSEEHTSELQSRQYLVCRLLLEKNSKITLHLFYALAVSPFVH